MASTDSNWRHRYTAPTDRDLDAVYQYVPLLPGGCEDVGPFGVADLARGQYLCEVCEDAMTDDTLPAAQSPTGTEIALCRVCRVQQGVA